MDESEDRELVEMAAVAVGITGLSGWSDNPIHRGIYMSGRYWNPLYNDEDAFRLACALEIDVMFRVVTTVRVEALAPGGPRITVPYKGASERAAAARLAITQAAAAKGRAMP